MRRLPMWVPYTRVSSTPAGRYQRFGALRHEAATRFKRSKPTCGTAAPWFHPLSSVCASSAKLLALLRFLPSLPQPAVRQPSRSVVHVTDPLFCSFSIDTTSFVGVERPFVPLTDPVLIQLTKELGPAYLRLGGSLQDHVIMNVSGDIPLTGLPYPTAFQPIYLNASLWDSLVEFCDAAGLDLVYGLSAAVGREVTVPPVWNVTNIRSLLEYVANKKQRLPVVELGNESNVFNCSSGTNTNISAYQLSTEYVALHALLAELTPGTRIWGPDPSITGDVKGQCHSWYGDDIFGFYRDFMAINAGVSTERFESDTPASKRSVDTPASATGAHTRLSSASSKGLGALDATTWHYYPQFQGQNDSSIALMLTNEYQHRIVAYNDAIVSIRDATAPGLPLVMGETSSFWGGGLANVSNRYASGLWYLNQLGYLAASGYSVMIRQDLVGGYYGLLDVNYAANGSVLSYSPNPDYYSTALWKQLISPRVLSTTVVGGSNATGVRAFAFCSARFDGSVVLVVSNTFNASTNLELGVVSGNASAFTGGVSPNATSGFRTG